VSAYIPAARGVGEFAVVEALPAVVVVVFAAVTHLADPWFLFALLAGVYWFGDDRLAAAPRRAGATAIALVAAGYAAVALGKASVAVPRPPGATGTVTPPPWLPSVLDGWYRAQLVSTGFGFPSGHATGAAVAYGALALVCTALWTPERRYAVATTVAVAVAASRVVIEVHYLVDVAAGLLLGAVVLTGGLALAGDSRLRTLSLTAPAGQLTPTPVFVLAAVVSVAAAAVAVANGHPEKVVEAAIGIGTGVGGAVGWQLATGTEPPVSVRLAVPGLLFTGGTWIGAYVLGGGVVRTTLVTAVAVAGVVAVPVVAARIE
jgi:membrane-associated phospholipid phosphatase